MDVRDAFRACIIALTGTGKTFTIRRIVDEAFNSGWSVAILPDAKDEYKSSKQPVQQEFKRKLPLGEEPKGLPMKIYRPFFFSNLGKLPKDNEWASVDITDLTKIDFQTLCGYETLTDKQKTDLDNLWDIMQENDISSVVEIKSVCVENNFNKLWNRIKFIETCGLFDSRFKVNPVDALKSRHVLVLNYDGFDKLDIKANSLDQVFLGIWLRWIEDAKGNNEISNLLIVNDETARWVPKNGEPSCKKQILESVDVTRGKGVSWFFGIQRKKSVPKDLLDQCIYKFIPYNVKRELFEELLKEEIPDMVPDMVRGKKTVLNMFAKLQKKFRWMLLKSNEIGEARVEFVDMYSPCSAHQKTKVHF